jgi:predicted transcriptional regulator
MTQETLRLPPDLSEVLDQLATALDQPRAHVIRLVLVAGVPEIRRRADAYREHVLGGRS